MLVVGSVSSDRDKSDKSRSLSGDVNSLEIYLPFEFSFAFFWTDLDTWHMTFALGFYAYQSFEVRPMLHLLLMAKA
jgi:hypothetical protein